MSYANSIGNSGVGGLNLVNSGAAASLTLGSANTYTGGTTINSGNITLISTSGSSLGTGPLTFAAPGGTLQLSGVSQTVPGLLNSYYLAGTNNIPIPATNLYTSVAQIQSTFGSLTPSPGVFLSSYNPGGSPLTTYYYGGNDNGNLNNFIPSTNGQGNAGGNGLNGGNNFTVISTGTINITTTGWYSFGTTSDNGSMLFINVGGTWQTVVNNNFFQGNRSARWNPEVGAGAYPIEIAYDEGGGGYMMSGKGKSMAPASPRQTRRTCLARTPTTTSCRSPATTLHSRRRRTWDWG